MGRIITQRELRNESGEIMRALDGGEAFTVTRNGVAVGELTPARHTFVDRDRVRQRFGGLAGIDPDRLRQDLDRLADPDATPGV